MAVSVADKVMDVGRYIGTSTLLDKVTNLGKYAIRHTHCLWEMAEAESFPHSTGFPYATGESPFTDLIGRAEKHLQILQGLDYFSDPRVLSALDKANEKGVRIEIIYWPNQQNQHIDNLMAFLLRNYKNVHLYETGKIEKQTHFIVADKTHVGMESLHPYGELPQVAYTKHKTLFLGNALRRRFTAIKRQATPKS